MSVNPDSTSSLRSIFVINPVSTGGRQRRAIFKRMEVVETNPLQLPLINETPERSRAKITPVDEAQIIQNTIKEQFAAGAALVSSILFCSHLYYVESKEKLFFKVMLYVFYSTFQECDAHETCTMISNKKEIFEVNVTTFFFFYLFLVGFSPLLLQNVISTHYQIYTRRLIHIVAMSIASVLASLFRSQNNFSFLVMLFLGTMASMILGSLAEKNSQKAFVLLVFLSIAFTLSLPDLFAHRDGFPFVIHLQLVLLIVMWIFEALIMIDMLEPKHVLITSMHILYSLVTTIVCWEFSKK